MKHAHVKDLGRVGRFIHLGDLSQGLEEHCRLQDRGEQLFYSYAGQEGYDPPFRNERSDGIVGGV